MDHWDVLKNLLTDLSSEERQQLLISTRENQSVFPFIRKLEVEEEGPSEPVVHEGLIKVSQIQALIWMLQGELHFGTVDPIEGDIHRRFGNNGREGLLPPELTFHKAYWTKQRRRRGLENLEVRIDEKLFDRHVPRLTDMLKKIIETRHSKKL